MGLNEITVSPTATNTSLTDEDTTSHFPHFHLNHTESVPALLPNATGNWTTEGALYEDESGFGLSTSVIVAIAVGSTAFMMLIIVFTAVLVRKRILAKKNKGWEDNLTLSYIADSNIDLTKDTYDEMISLDNDSFLNSLDTHSFSVFSPDSNTRQYTYSYF